VPGVEAPHGLEAEGAQRFRPVLQIVEVDDEQLMITTVVHVVTHSSDDAVREAIQQRNAVASGAPRAAIEFVDGVAGLLSEQLGEIAIVGLREVQREGARPLRDAVGVVHLRDPHRPPRWVDAALRVEAHEASGQLAVRRGGDDEHRLVEFARQLVHESRMYGGSSLRRNMLDHVFTDAIGALRDTFENALLERQAFEERFQADVLLGDLTWETSYGLPGEGSPPRVRADITLDWPTWAQSAYRSWYIGEPLEEGPRIEIEIILRIQRVATPPEASMVLSVLPEQSPPMGVEPLERTGPTIETIYGHDLTEAEYAIEVSYEGSYELDEDTLKDGSVLDLHFGAMGGWIASTLVRLGDLKFEFLPPDPDEENGR